MNLTSAGVLRVLRVLTGIGGWISIVKKSLMAQVSFGPIAEMPADTGAQWAHRVPSRHRGGRVTGPFPRIIALYYPGFLTPRVACFGASGPAHAEV